MLAVIIIVVLLLVLGAWGVSAYNGFVKMRNAVEEAFSTMDVYMKKRYDLIPNLVETVKGYAKHEASTLENVVQARNMAQNATTAEGRIEGDNILSGTLKSLFAIAEAYPDLKANTNFIDLQNQLKAVEEDIANSRKYYNAVVRDYNTKTEVFPSNLIASIFKFARKPMYEVDSAEERKNVQVGF